MTTPPLPSATPWQHADRAAHAPGADVVAGVGLDTGVLAAGNTLSSLSSTMPTSPSGTAVVTAVGEIDFRTAPALSSRLHQAIETCAAVVLDLSAVTLFESAGHQILECAADHARTLAVTFTVMCPGPSAVCCALRPAVLMSSPAKAWRPQRTRSQVSRS